MINLTLELSEEDRKTTQIELLIKILAAQKATTEIMIEMFRLDNEDGLRLINSFDQKIEVLSNMILEDLFERRSITDINKILDGSQND